MPPSLLLDGSRIECYGDYAAGVKRAHLTFTSDTQITVSDKNSQAIRLNGIANPTASDDAVPKSYVDATATGMAYKEPVRVRSDIPINIATPPTSIDSVTLAVDDRVLLTAQTNATENGIWVNSATGFVRPADFLVGYQAHGTYVFVDEGTAFKDRSYVCTNDKANDVVGTAQLVWVQFGARPDAYAGFGLMLGTGNALDVDTRDIAGIASNNTFSGTNTFQNTVTVDAPVVVTSTSGVDTKAVTGLLLTSMTTDGNAVSVEYVKKTVNQLPTKLPVRAASTAAIADLADLKAGFVMDTVTLVAGDRVLLKDQDPVASQNGLYLIGQDSSTRTSDLATSSNAEGVIVFCCQGFTNGDQLFACNSDPGTSVTGTNALVFVAVGNRPGAGLSTEAGTMKVNVNNTSMEIDGNNDLSVKAAGITDSHILTGTIANDKLANHAITLGVTGRGLAVSTGTINLGGNSNLSLNFSVVPDLAAANTFLENTIFEKVVTAADVQVTSPGTGPTSLVNRQVLADGLNQLKMKSPALVASTGSPVDLSVTLDGVSLDGTVLAAGDRVLLKDQAALGVENGIYVVLASPALAARALDLPTGDAARDACVLVTSGETSGKMFWVCTSPATACTVDTDGLVFTQMSNSASQLAGDGLTSNGYVLSVNTDSSTLTVIGDQVLVKDSGIVTAKIADGAVTNAKLQYSSIPITATGGLTAPTTIALGSNLALGIDGSVVAKLAGTNLFTGSNTFDNLHVANTAYFTGDIDMVAPGVNTTSVVNRQVLADGLNHLKMKSPVLVASTGSPVDLSVTLDGVSLDGTVLAAGDRVLLKDQAALGVENGIYVVLASPALATRTLDLPTGDAARDACVLVTSGETSGKMFWVCTSPTTACTVDTDGLVFTQMSNSASQLAGDGLTSNGYVLSVNTDNSTLTVIGDHVLVKDAGITNAKLLNPSIPITATGGITAPTSIALGDNLTLGIDGTVVAKLAGTNLFTGSNTFDNLHVANTAYFTGDIDMVAPGVNTTSVVNRQVLADQLNDVRMKVPVRVVSSGPIDISVIAPDYVLDGQTLVAGDRILLKDQAAPAENGIYVVPVFPALAIRAADFTTGDSTKNAVVLVTSGLLGANQFYWCSSDVVVDGIAAIAWQATGNSPIPLAGAGLGYDAEKLVVNVDGATIEINGTTDALQVKAGGITNTMLGGSIDNSKLTHSSIQVVTQSGLLGGTTVALGDTVTLRPDFTVVPNLGSENTFTQINNFGGAVNLTANIASTSQTTGTLVVTGGVGISGDLYTTNTWNMSDERLKKNVQTISGALDTVSAMRGCFFDWNDQIPELENTPSVGVIAQEMKACAPLLVTQSVETDLCAVEYAKTVPYLIEAIKELKRKVELLESAAAAPAITEPVAKRARKH